MNVVFSHNSSIHFDFSHVDFCTHCGKKVFVFFHQRYSKLQIQSQLPACISKGLNLHSLPLVILDDFIQRALHEDYVLSYAVDTTQTLLNVKQTWQPLHYGTRLQVSVSPGLVSLQLTQLSNGLLKNNSVTKDLKFRNSLHATMTEVKQTR